MGLAQQREEMVDLGQMVDLVFRGPPLRSTTVKLRKNKELRRKWWAWWTFFASPTRIRAGARTRPRDTQAKVGLRSTTSTKNRNSLWLHRLAVVDLTWREVHHLMVKHDIYL